MNDRFVADLFCEDSAHERFAVALVRRLAREARIDLAVRPRATRGGHGAALTELKAWQRTVGKGGIVGTPDLLMILIDGNCKGWNQARAEIESLVLPGLFPHVVVGCPDPHIERWCMADRDAFRAVVERPPLDDPGKCERALYKRLLAESLKAANAPVVVDPMEYAADFVAEMDYFRAKKAQPSLGTFIDELKKALLSLA